MNGERTGARESIWDSHSLYHQIGGALYQMWFLAVDMCCLAVQKLSLLVTFRPWVSLASRLWRDCRVLKQPSQGKLLVQNITRYWRWMAVGIRWWFEYLCLNVSIRIDRTYVLEIRMIKLHIARYVFSSPPLKYILASHLGPFKKNYRYLCITSSPSALHLVIHFLLARLIPLIAFSRSH